jgi:hypothetical protein
MNVTCEHLDSVKDVEPSAIGRLLGPPAHLHVVRPCRLL